MQPALKHKIALLMGVCAASISPLSAQELSVGGNTTDEIVVIGSHIRRASQKNSPSPIVSVASKDINAVGAKSIADLVQTLTINTGAQNNIDAFTQNITTGTSNINLRGLGVASTLVLLNGRRQVLTAVTTNDGLSFVDTASLMPMIAVDRVEVLKDGAAALYGSDAVAGVVNFVTRKNFEGFELSTDYQTITGEGDQSEYSIQGIIGVQGDRSHLVAAMSYTDRGDLTTAERRLSRPQDDSSALGNPGSFFGVSGFPAGTPVIDPTGCEEFGGLLQIFASTPSGDAGFCRFDFGSFFNLVPKETRLQAYVQGSYDLADNIQFETEFSYARNRAFRGNSPSFPILTLPTVPVNNPGNVFGAPVSFFGRAIGNSATGPTSNESESDTWRFSAGLSGEFENDWYWEIGYTRAENDFLFRWTDTLANEFQDALNGFGGPSCNGPTDPSAIPGQGDCLFFNPFSTSFTTLPNDPAVFEGFTARQTIDAKSTLTTIDAIASGDIFDLPSGPLGVAVGFQYRDESLDQDYDEFSNQDAFAFLIGNPDFGFTRDVYAIFAEVSVPILDNLELQAAVRYEDYGGAIGDTIDPKVALLFQPLDNLSLRASYSTSFRAPSLFQVGGTSTSLNQVVDPILGGTAFAAVRAVGNSALAPEESEAWNIGATFEPVEGLEFNVDYWRFDFTDVIIQENFQAIVDAFPQDPTRVIRAGDPINGPIIRVNTNFVNASSVETDGLDFSAKYGVDTRFGFFQPFFEGTYILNYDLIDPQAGAVNGAGSRNFRNFGTSTPQLRFNSGIAWAAGAHSINTFVRHIASYDDDQNPGTEVGSHTTLDVQYNFDLSDWVGDERNAVLSIGAINLTDNAPPQVFTNIGFDTKVHDPRGRLVYVRATMGF